MLEAQFEISCSQCGGQEFRQIFPVPAATYHLYGPEDERAQTLTRREIILMRANNSSKSNGLSM